MSILNNVKILDLIIFLKYLPTKNPQFVDQTKFIWDVYDDLRITLVKIFIYNFYVLYLYRRCDKGAGGRQWQRVRGN